MARSTSPIHSSLTSSTSSISAGVFRIAPDGGVTAERKGATTEAPNGIVLSPDETRLYVSNSEADLVWIFDVGADGSLSEARTFVSTGDVPDGMAIDTAGNLLVTSHQRHRGLRSRWRSLGRHPRAAAPANCAFGDVDGRTLYITATAGSNRVTLTLAGLY